MVINNRIHSKKIEDKVFWYKAKEVPDFKLGSKDLKVIMKNFTMKIGIKKYQFLT